ncbi:hypothetical protein SKAU_G00423300 [Synaphobranchus kaupii]|uniref:DUF4371 domain-containing protein n=1 Tax=Synaphobranchus kaupii TaxID=118154 RepID=A0A9Q1E5D2_SYNKA|nr:hypothetical protein SKAU_G00423300 [Synaphobranchus kaupii]
MDVSIRDLEGICVRFLKDGQPNDMFVAVEELKHATATGHREAINAALEKVGLNDWKEKTVGFGSDGAAVMVTDLLRGLYKQYHYSPKAWRELRELVEILNIKIWKPANLGRTRWLPHIEKALNTLMRDYTPVLTHMENTLETRSASADMLGRARQCTQLLFVGLVQDILQVLSWVKTELLDTVQESLRKRFKDVETPCESSR